MMSWSLCLVHLYPDILSEIRSVLKSFLKFNQTTSQCFGGVETEDALFGHRKLQFIPPSNTVVEILSTAAMALTRCKSLENKTFLILYDDISHFSLIRKLDVNCALCVSMYVCVRANELTCQYSGRGDHPTYQPIRNGKFCWKRN